MPTRDGRSLHAMVLRGPGTNAPTVVFEAGAAASRSTWALIQPEVSAWARAIVYGRSGLGRSEPDRRSRKRTGSGMNAKVRAIANASHAHRAGQSPQGRHVVAERSGHYVPVAEPRVVAAEIGRLVR